MKTLHRPWYGWKHFHSSEVNWIPRASHSFPAPHGQTDTRLWLVGTLFAPQTAYLGFHLGYARFIGDTRHSLDFGPLRSRLTSFL